MRELRTADWYEISGRGHVAVIAEADLSDVAEVRDLIGEVVLVDGVARVVRAVETCLVAHHDHRKESFGLLVGAPEGVEVA